MLKSIFSSKSSKSIIFLLLTGLILFGKSYSQTRHFPAGAHEIVIANASGVRTDLLKNIAPVVEKSIARGDYPGAVILIGHRGQIIYRGVLGNRRIVPNIAPMRFDTIFDIASLTKIVVTTPAIMQLVEQGRIDLDAPVSQYWPAFAKQGKQSVTIRELLTHTSGLPLDVANPTKKSTSHAVIKKIEQLKLLHSPGSKFLYSDLNFIVLAHLVEMISKERIDHYAQNHIFKPLGMKNTFFTPSEKLRERIAPTELINKKLRWGQVHDPIAYSIGGISGNAGVFSDAKDLGIYAQSLLDGGKLPHVLRDKNNKLDYFLGPLSITKMTTAQTPDSMVDVRGLGWDIDSSYSNRGVLLPTQSFGHTGWTGTSLWIDPVTQTWIVILTSRAHPSPAINNQLAQDRRTIANIVSASLVDVASFNFNNTGKGELSRAYTIINK
ncbi:MAG: beta-lactamase family protein [Gammaproteobacteria bacterium]|nr:beta-lactamase family protein [Gammaproteobacteria bacterium]MCW5582775.1 beta-lactamase family protein [Gammaproteobacteria bacterium]